MFDLDKWQEILNTVRKNKLRTFLTMFGVFWGIFMLLLLLGGGSGLRNGVERDFSGGAKNAVFTWSRKTTMPYKGMKPGRWIRLNLSDVDYLRENLPEAELVLPRNQLGGYQDANNVVRKNKTGAFSIYSAWPDAEKFAYREYPHGRWINQNDIDEGRKVCVIGLKVLSILFPEGGNPVGDYIRINGVYFKVVGVHKSRATGDDSDRDMSSIFVPFTAFQKVFNYGDIVGWMSILPKEGVEASIVEEKAKKLLRENHSIHPNDRAAMGSYNTEEDYLQIENLFAGINMFIWVVGIGTLLAGVIGVSNIMLIIVKERTKEIGIRKSLGATPWSIVSLIIQESVVITVLAGYGGLLLGTMLIEGINTAIKGQDTGMFRNPEIDLGIALTALSVLIIAGALAGLIPARKAAAINPIEALRSE